MFEKTSEYNTEDATNTLCRLDSEIGMFKRGESTLFIIMKKLVYPSKANDLQKIQIHIYAKDHYKVQQGILNLLKLHRNYDDFYNKHEHIYINSINTKNR